MSYYPPNTNGVAHPFPAPGPSSGSMAMDEDEWLYGNNGDAVPQVMEMVNWNPGDNICYNGTRLRFQSLENKLKTANEQLQFLDAAMTSEKRRAEVIQEEKEEQENRLARVEGEKQGLGQKLVELTEEMEGMTADLKGDRKIIANLMGVIGDRDVRIKERDQTIVENGEANKKLAKDLEVMTKSNMEMLSDLEESGNRIGKLEEQIRNLITARDENEQKLTELQGQNENLVRTNTELEMRMVELKRENERLKAAEAETEQRIAGLVEKIKKLEGDRDEQELLTVKVERAAEGIMEKLSRLRASKNPEPIASTTAAVGIQIQPETVTISSIKNLPVAKLNVAAIAKQNASTSKSTSTHTNLKLPLENMSPSTTPMEKLSRLIESITSEPTASNSATVRNRIQPEDGTPSSVQNLSFEAITKRIVEPATPCSVQQDPASFVSVEYQPQDNVVPQAVPSITIAATNFTSRARRQRKLTVPFQSFQEMNQSPCPQRRHFVTGRRGQSKDNKKMHGIAHSPEGIAKNACLCKLQHPNKKKLMSHVWYAKLPAQFPCNKCPKLFKTTSSLKQHLWNAHDQTEYSMKGCTKCGALCNNMQELQRHKTQKCCRNKKFEDALASRIAQLVSSPQLEPQQPTPRPSTAPITNSNKFSCRAKLTKHCKFARTTGTTTTGLEAPGSQSEPSSAATVVTLTPIQNVLLNRMSSSLQLVPSTSSSCLLRPVYPETYPFTPNSFQPSTSNGNIICPTPDDTISLTTPQNYICRM